MHTENNNDDRWERLNIGLQMALHNCEHYPEDTTFLAQLSNALRSASGDGRIDWVTMERIDTKLNECRKALGELAFSADLI